MRIMAISLEVVVASDLVVISHGRYIESMTKERHSDYLQLSNLHKCNAHLIVQTYIW